MAVIKDSCKEVLEKAEWISLLTFGKNNPHMVATWGEFVRSMGIEADTLAVPAGWMHTTAENLEKNKSIEVIAASKQVRSSRGYGQGCRLKGSAVIETAGPYAERAKELFP